MMVDFLRDCGLHAFYASSMRGSLFSGFLTMGGFLLSAHTFIIIHMKKEVYDHVEYQKRIRDVQSVNPGHTYYGGLLRLSRFLVWSIAACLIASLSQLTLGLLPYNLTAILCLVLAGVAVTLLGISVVIMAANLKQWINDLELMSPTLLAKLDEKE